MRRSVLVITPSFSGHCAAGTDVGEHRRAGRMEGVLGDDQGGGFERTREMIKVRHRHCRVGTDDPDRFDAAAGQPVEDLERGKSGVALIDPWANRQ